MIIATEIFKKWTRTKGFALLLVSTVSLNDYRHLKHPLILAYDRTTKRTLQRLDSPAWPGENN